jgi:hypothetical protein
MLATALILLSPRMVRSQVETGAPAVLAEFAVDPRAEAIFLPVRVGGEERLFLLDTGSTLSVFDRRLSSGASIGEIPVTPPSGPPVEKGLYPAPEAFVGGLDMRGSGPVLYNDFAQMRAVTDRSVWGVIGIQFLKRYIVQLDLDAGKVRFLDPRTHPRADWGSAMPILSGPGGIPAVAARITGQPPEEFEIDTGDNSGGDLDRAVFQRLFPHRRGARSKDLLFTGIESSSLGRASEVTVGDISFHGIVFESADMSSLGLAFVRRSMITFDFPRGTMYLKAGKRIETEEDADMSGLHLLRQEGRIVALAVDADSPAAQAGMLNGDVIVDAAGPLEARGDIVALRRLLCSGDGKTVELTVLRGGRTIPVRLRLRKIL